jgi:hypothetical protein
VMAKVWQHQTVSSSADDGLSTATGASAVGITMGMSGAAVPTTPVTQPLMTANQYVAALSRDFRALPDVPDDDESVDFDPDL